MPYNKLLVAKSTYSLTSHNEVVIMKVKFERNTKKALFLFMLFICTFMITKASDVPLPLFIQESALGPALLQFRHGNDIMMSISTGYIVSALFYLMVVYFPEKKKKEDVAPLITNKVDEIITNFGSLYKNIISASAIEVNIPDLTQEKLKTITSNIDLSAPSPIMIPAYEFQRLYPHLDPMTYEPMGFKRGDNASLNDVTVKTPNGYHFTYILRTCSSSIEEAMKYSHFVDSEVLSKVHKLNKRLQSWGYVSFEEFYKYENPSDLFNYGTTYLWEIFTLTKELRKNFLQIYPHKILHDPLIK